MPATTTATIDPASPTDVVTITKAKYDSKKRKLDVEATSSSGGAEILTATAYDDDDDGVVLGTVVLKYDAKKAKHKGKITGLDTKPFRIEVASTGGGSDSLEGSEIDSK